MKKIDKLLSNTQITEMASAAQRIVVASKEHDFSSDAYLSDILTQLETKTNALSVAIAPDKTISPLEEKDKERDVCVRAVFNINNGYLYSPITAMSNAAQQVAEVLNKYGLKITDENYAQATGYIDSLLTDLEAETLQASVNALPGLNEAIINLQTAEQDFINSRVALEQARGNEADTVTATSLKQEVLYIINDALVEYIRPMRKANAELYESFAATLAEIVAENNQTVKGRRIGEINQ